MVSPARAHFLRVQAEKAHSLERNALAGLDGYDLQLATLNLHQRALKALQSLERRIEYKRAHFAEFRPWVEGALAAGSGKQDDVLIAMLIWALDIGEWSVGLNIAEYAIRHDLALPSGFTRSLPAFVVEQIADAAKSARDLKQPFALETMSRTLALTTECDVLDVINAKFYKELGLLMAESAPETALTHLTRALQLDNNCGVKGEIAKLEKRLAKANTDTRNPA